MRGRIDPPIARLCALAIAVAGAGCHARHQLPWSGFVDAPVAAVAAQVSGRLESVPVREGDRVARGQLLAQLDARERLAAAAQARAEVERAEQQLREAEQNAAAAVPTVTGARADIARQRATVTDARLNYDRTRRLERRGAATPAQLDDARARRDEAEAQLASITAARSATGGRALAADRAVDTARAAVATSQAALALAEAQLAEEEVRAPFDALVVNIDLRPGEWAAPGTPVVTVEDLSRQWVRIDVEESRIGELAIGQGAEIRVVAFPRRSLGGHVIEVGAEGEFALNRDVKRGRPDVRTFRVRVGLDRIAYDLRPGMTAEVTLRALTPAGMTDGGR